MPALLILSRNIYWNTIWEMLNSLININLEGSFSEILIINMYFKSQKSVLVCSIFHMYLSVVLYFQLHLAKVVFYFLPKTVF